jgi:Protein of unknown function (DUF2865)
MFKRFTVFAAISPVRLFRPAAVAFSTMLSACVLAALPVVVFVDAEQQLQSAPLAATANSEMLVVGAVTLTGGRGDFGIENNPWQIARPSPVQRPAARSGLFSTRPASTPFIEVRRPAVRIIVPRAPVTETEKPQYVQSSVKRYRTLCVRTCDGYYFPISAGATGDALSDDAATCKASCGSPTKLYYHEGGEETIEQAIDLDGNKYMSLPTALSYRSQLTASCQCQPQPWEEAALAKHRKYAEVAAKKNLVLAARETSTREEPRRKRIVRKSTVRLETVAAKVKRQVQVADYGTEGLITTRTRKRSAKLRTPSVLFENTGLTGLVNFTAQRKSPAVRARRAPSASAGSGPLNLPKYLQ